MSERANIAAARLHPFDKALDSRRAGENYPVERVPRRCRETFDRAVQRCVAPWRCGFDRWKFHDLRAEPPKRGRELRRTRARARYYNSAAEQWRALDPLQMFAHSREFSDDDYGRRANPFARSYVRERRQRCAEGFLRGRRGPLYCDCRCFIGKSGSANSIECGAHSRRRHQDHDGAAVTGRRDQLVPRHRARTLAFIFMAGDERDERAVPAMRQRNSRERRPRNCRRDARYHFELDMRARQRLGLLATASENKRIAALEPHNDAPLARVRDQHRVQF